MRIGIDISQLAFQGTGVATFLSHLVETMLKQDKENEYILFYSSLRKEFKISNLKFQINDRKRKVQIKQFKLPPTLLDILWNKLHILPIEWLIGPVDVFISSDWTQPPSKSKKMTILYDLIVYKYPQETHNQTSFSFKNLLISPNIVASQRKRLAWVKKEVDKILCISASTKKDAMEILGLPEEKFSVIYPGI